MLAPLALGLSNAAMATGIVVGVLAVGLGLAGTAPNGRGTLTVSTQAVYDQGLAMGLLLTGAAFAVVGDTPALALFGGLGVLTLFVAGTTRYTARPAPPSFL